RRGGPTRHSTCTRPRAAWRDLERRATRYGMPFRRPSVFPRNGLLAARVMILAAEEPWAHDFGRAVFRANFAEDRDIASAEVVSAILADLGQEPQTLL